MADGFDAVYGSGLVDKVLIPSLLAPLFGIFGAALLMTILLWVIRAGRRTVNRCSAACSSSRRASSPSRTGRTTRRRRWGSSRSRWSRPVASVRISTVRPWVVVSAAAAIAAGTYAGGWRIIRTLGQRIAKLQPPQGFSAETATVNPLSDRPLRLPGIDDAHDLWLRPRGRCDPPAFCGSLGSCRQHPACVAATIPCAGLVGAGMQLVTRIPGGAVIVFLLVLADRRDGVPCAPLGDAQAPRLPRRLACLAPLAAGPRRRPAIVFARMFSTR